MCRSREEGFEELLLGRTAGRSLYVHTWLKGGRSRCFWPVHHKSIKSMKKKYIGKAPEGDKVVEELWRREARWPPVTEGCVPHDGMLRDTVESEGN